MQRIIAACLGVCASGLLAFPATSQARPFEPMDVFALQWVDNPQISPDGNRIVYQRMGFSVMQDRKQSSLWMTDADGRNHRPLAGSGFNPVWSPDGRRIAYVAASEGSAQIQMHWLDGGQDAQLTGLTEAPENLVWSPDGRWLAFTMRVDAEDAPLASMPKAPEGAKWAAPVKVINRVIYRMDGGGYVDPGYTHVFVISSDGGPARQVTQGKHNFDGQPIWARDGKSLIVSANLSDDWEYQPIDSELYRVNLADGSVTRLTERAGPDRAPALSSDGKQLAWLGFDDKRHPYQAMQLNIGNADASNARSLTSSFDFSIDAISWDGSRGLWLQFDDHGRGCLGWIAASGGAVKRVTCELGGTEIGRPYSGGSFSSVADRLAFTSGTTSSPPNLAVLAGNGKPRMLTDLDANLLDHITLGKVEEITVKSSADGRDIQAWVVTPPGFDPAKKYPLLLEIHGGPFAAYGPWFAPEIQLYAAAGYVVVYANPRGSTSYGTEFANLIENAYPGQDYDDLMSVVDATIARGSIDTDNLFVTGGSGGGALTAWIVGHTDRFRAAVSAKPVINWSSFVLTSDFYPFFTRYWFTGFPWENAENYVKRSPITYVGNVKTPTMMLVGDDDHRTPASEAEQFYQALKLRKVDTAMVRIPGASHAINARPSNMIAQVLNTIAWFEKHRSPAKSAK